MDLYPLYPASLRPSFLTDIRQWYLATYKDRFFTAQAPNWFWFFMVMEAVYHFPFSVYAIGKLWGRHGKYLDPTSRFAELYVQVINLLERSKLYEKTVDTIEATPLLYSSSSICFCIYKCSTAILYFPLLLCTRVPRLRYFVPN